MLRMEKRYTPADHESRLFERWQATGVFAGDPASPKPPYTIALPPPNVTGELHMGHALNGSTQDTLIRLRRMQGHETQWICGTDHASIAVHAVIEKQLRAEGTTRWDLGRDVFLERVWQWRATTGATIIQQFKRLGCTLDYEHERFTMDEGYVKAVLTMFVRLFRKGAIYRDNRLINWCPTCASTISDLEVRHEHAHDTLFHVRYRIKGTNDFLKVATVRPETILADTAIAVHPDDERYKHLVGQTAIVPLVEREVPIIADDYVKTDFGTGVLKVTPGHDPNDFEIGRRHGLEELAAIGFDGRMTELAGEFAGLTAAEARKEVRDALFDRQLLAGEEGYEHEVGHCDRTGDRVEPLISLQWFMRMDELAKPANEAVRSGRVRFHPKTQENTYFSWMDNLRPWCISRQLWWGHQIPVWYCPDGHITVEMEEPSACAECGSAALTRDPDVLDTWFSAALWPFATIGWPGEDPRLDRFYPGDVLSTARDIINLWVARMLMMGIEFMGDIPFSDVLIHSTIQAPDGRRMSKSLGTGIDPLHLVDEFGADATRYGLLKMSSTQDVRFDEGAIREGSALANKLWNASRFVLNQADAVEPVEPSGPGLRLEDRWIRSRFDEALADVLRQIDRYDFSAAVKTLYSFVWNDFCDWYIELSKESLYGDDPDRRRAASQTLHWVLQGILRMAHPIMPFVTEAIWENFSGGGGAVLMLAPYPAPDPGRRDPDATAQMDEHMEQVREKRRAEQDAAAASAEAAGPTDHERLEQARAERDRAQRMLASEGFLAKAPPAKIEEEREKVRRFSALVEELEARLAEQ
jgi:valyl-tRNA synthetase